MSWTEFLRLIANHFDEEEVRTICFGLGIDYDDLGGRGKKANIREMVAKCRRANQMQELVEVLSSERPFVPWQNILSNHLPLSLSFLKFLLLVFVAFLGVITIVSLLRSVDLPQIPDATLSSTISITQVVSSIEPTAILSTPSPAPTIVSTPTYKAQSNILGRWQLTYASDCYFKFEFGLANFCGNVPYWEFREGGKGNMIIDYGEGLPSQPISANYGFIEPLRIIVGYDRDGQFVEELYDLDIENDYLRMTRNDGLVLEFEK